MRKSSPTISKVLENTEFSGLIEKFNSLGIEYIFDLIPIYKSGQLLNYIKNFEKDDYTALKLEALFREQLIKKANPALSNLFYIVLALMVFGFLLFFIFLFTKIR